MVGAITTRNYTVNGVIFKHSIEVSDYISDRDQYHCSIAGYKIVIKQRGDRWVAFINSYLVSTPWMTDKLSMFEFLTSEPWNGPEHIDPDHVDSPESMMTFGFRNHDWYYDDQLVFKRFYGNCKIEYYFGYVKGVEIKVFTNHSSGRYGNWIASIECDWIASIEGDLIPDCSFGRRADLFKWLVEEWDGRV